MSDRRLLFLAFALVARPLAAQDDLALLRRRVANLEARREVLARAVATISAACAMTWRGWPSAGQSVSRSRFDHVRAENEREDEGDDDRLEGLLDRLVRRLVGGGRGGGCGWSMRRWPGRARGSAS